MNHPIGCGDPEAISAIGTSLRNEESALILIRKNWIHGTPHGFEDLIKNVESKGLETCHFQFSKKN
jgi:hypothetical protein